MQIKTVFYDLIGHITAGVSLLFAVYLVYHHSLQCHQPLVELREYIQVMGAIELAVFILFSYLAGHYLSIASFFIIEWLLLKIPLLSRFYLSSSILGTNLYKTFEEKFQETFGSGPERKDLSLCVCYVEDKHPAVYSSAMVFKSFYIMTRNLTLILAIYSLCEIFNWLVIGNSQSSQFLFMALPAGLISFIHYLFFMMCFKRRILTGFIIP